MSNEEEQEVCETKLKTCDFLQLSDNTSEVHYCDKVKCMGGVDPN